MGFRFTHKFFTFRRGSENGQPSFWSFFHLVKNMFYFPLLVLKGIYHYWTCFFFFIFSRGLLSKWRQEPTIRYFGFGFEPLVLAEGKWDTPEDHQTTDSAPNHELGGFSANGSLGPAFLWEPFWDPAFCRGKKGETGLILEDGPTSFWRPICSLFLK